MTLICPNRACCARDGGERPSAPSRRPPALFPLSLRREDTERLAHSHAPDPPYGPSGRPDRERPEGRSRAPPEAAAAPRQSRSRPARRRPPAGSPRGPPFRPAPGGGAASHAASRPARPAPLPSAALSAPSCRAAAAAGKSCSAPGASQQPRPAALRRPVTCGLAGRAAPRVCGAALASLR